MNVEINGNTVKIIPTAMQGGEATIYKWGKDKVVKIYKTPDHPDFEGLPKDQEGARKRIREHQRKLLEFPQNMPSHVICPRHDMLARDSKGLIVGYGMNFVKNAEVMLRYGEPDFGKSVPNERVKNIFTNLYDTLLGSHKRGVVFGDFNDLNVLVSGEEAYIIDADSAQFGSYYCMVYTEKFIDPLLADPNAKRPVLSRPYNEASDWYAYAIMLMQSFLYVGPYGGLYKPKDKSKRIPHDSRPLKRITVFHPEVGYPKPATHWKILPDDLLHFFHGIFIEDKRGVFPRNLLDDLRWTKCTSCGAEHARPTCPECAAVSPVAIKETLIIRGTVTAKNVFKTKGTILNAAYQGGKMRWLYHEDGKYKREGGEIVIAGELDPQMRFRLKSDKTLIAKGNQIVIVDPDKGAERVVVDTYGMLPVYDTNEDNHFWLNNGQVLRDDDFGSLYIGDVLQEQTLFWVGPKFGFGFYRAGEICNAFVFDAKRGKSINDTVKIPPIRGQLVDSTCVFSDKLAWFFTTTQEKGKLINRCHVINSLGELLATEEAEKGSDHWLGYVRGACPINKFLLTPTDEGIVRVEIDNSRLVETKRFPDTEQFVDTDSKLLAGPDGLNVMRRQEIILLTIK